MRLFNRATGGVFVLAGAYLLTLERPRCSRESARQPTLIPTVGAVRAPPIPPASIEGHGVHACLDRIVARGNASGIGPVRTGVATDRATNEA